MKKIESLITNRMLLCIGVDTKVVIVIFMLYIFIFILPSGIKMCILLKRYSYSYHL